MLKNLAALCYLILISSSVQSQRLDQYLKLLDQSQFKVDGTNFQQSFSTAAAALLQSVNINYYTSTTCSTPAGSNTLAGGDGGTTLKTGTYYSTPLSNYSLCGLYSGTHSGCSGLLTDAGSSVKSMQFVYNFYNGLTVTSTCMYNSSNGYEAELDYTGTPAACSNSACGFTRSYTFALPVTYFGGENGVVYANNTVLAGTAFAGTPDGSNVNAIALDSSNNIYVATNNSFNSNGDVYSIAADGNSAWSQVGSLSDQSLLSIAVDGSNHVYVGTVTGNVWEYVSGNWTELGGSSLSIDDGGTINTLAVSGGNVYAATNNGNVWEFSSGAWNNLGSPDSSGIGAIAVSGSTVYAGTNNGNVLKTTQSGGTWSSWTSAAPGSLDGSAIGSIVLNVVLLYAGTNNGNVYVGSAGSSWSEVGGSTLANSDGSNINSVVMLGGNVYAGTGSAHVWGYISGTWTQIGGGALPYLGRVTGLAASGSNLYVGASNYDGGGNVYISADSAAWSGPFAKAVDGGFISSIAVDSSNNVYAGTWGPLGQGNVWEYHSGSWTQLGAASSVPDICQVSAIAVSGSNVYAGTNGSNNGGTGDVYLSTSGGA